MQFSTLVYAQILARLIIIFFKQVAKKALRVFVDFTMSQLSIFFLLSSAARIFADRWSSMSKAEIVFLCPKHNFFFCLDQSYFLRSKIVIYFFMSSLLYLIPRDFINVLKCVFTTLKYLFCIYFQNKAVYRAEDRPTDRCLKIAFT